ncbi:hypothetical protein M2305_002149 [Gluconobacter cerinus]|uniref:DUF2877 domain-containing protein n=1 Tax=Gluconobacter cerinus TaxID=38307 RepID=UPI0022269EBD|nr:DUF2877 domain-containing protein [Gluconobacter cerinus]MCW2266202.1 hypothetical protein [Gluconobacter cerinus]
MMKKSVLRIASFATDCLAGIAGPVRVLAIFPRHVYLLVGQEAERTMLIISPSGGGMTPYSVVVDPWPIIQSSDEDGWFDGRTLILGSVSICLEGAPSWPSGLSVRHAEYRQRAMFALLTEDARNLSHHSDYLAFVLDDPCRLDLLGGGANILACGLVMREKEMLIEGARCLAGLGMGLTPAGDDFLCGVMMAVRIILPVPNLVCDSLVLGARGNTTTLSLSFMEAAACGHASEDWHKLIAVGFSRTVTLRQRALCAVIAHGFSSGADTLAGFLWGGWQLLHSRETYCMTQ